VPVDETPLDDSHPGAPRTLEDLPWRLAYGVRYVLLLFLGPPTLEGRADPRTRMRETKRRRWEERAVRRQQG
jgi:hypothetical protein